MSSCLPLLRVHLTLDDFPLRAPQLLETDAGMAFQILQVDAMFSAHPAIVLSECFAERALNLLLQRAGLAVKRAHGVHGFVHAIDQSSALTVGKTKFADNAGNPHDLAAQAESAATVFTGFLP